MTLTAGARFIRGFTRIGAVIAVLTAVIGVPASIVAGINSYNSAVDKHEAARCIARLARSGVTFREAAEEWLRLNAVKRQCVDPARPAAGLTKPKRPAAE